MGWIVYLDWSKAKKISWVVGINQSNGFYLSQLFSKLGSSSMGVLLLV